MTYDWKKAGLSAACYCMGPRDGEPLCPCQMRLQGIFERDGQWIRPAQPEQVITPAVVRTPKPLAWASGLHEKD